MSPAGQSLNSVAGHTEACQAPSPLSILCCTKTEPLRAPRNQLQQVSSLGLLPLHPRLATSSSSPGNVIGPTPDSSSLALFFLQTHRLVLPPQMTGAPSGTKSRLLPLGPQCLAQELTQSCVGWVLASRPLPQMLSFCPGLLVLSQTDKNTRSTGQPGEKLTCWQIIVVLGDMVGTQHRATTSPGRREERLQSHQPNWTLRVKQGLSRGVGEGKTQDSSLDKARRAQHTAETARVR